MRRRVVFVLAGLVTLAVAYYLVTLVQVWRTGRADGAQPAEAIVVLGAAQYDGRPSPQLQGRLDRVLELWEAGLAPIVVVTGGNQPGDRFTEAEASADYLVEAGVPAEAILAEDQGASTWESLEAVAALLAPLGADEVLLVSDPFHLLRVRLIADEVGLVPHTTPTTNGSMAGWESVVKHAKEAAGVAVGRIIGFERLWRVTG